MIMHYDFEWDRDKAKINIVKHKISLDHAATVFKDARAITIYDEEHSDAEERWITMGLSQNGILLVVSHTYNKIDDHTVSVRIISCRKATRKESRQYIEED
jgi:uncharacterized protein